MSTSDVCLDANIFIASLIPEQDQDICQNLISTLQQRDTTFYAPALIVFEVSSALFKKHTLKEISRGEQEKALGLFFDFPLLLQWQSSLLLKTLTFSQRMGCKNTYDAAYLAVAQAKGIPCITLDQEFCKRGKKIYKNMFSVQEYLKKIS